jgi:hypothetical protein
LYNQPYWRERDCSGLPIVTPDRTNTLGCEASRESNEAFLHQSGGDSTRLRFRPYLYVYWKSQVARPVFAVYKFSSRQRPHPPRLAMSYNQSFAPQPGQGNLSAQFVPSQYQSSTGGSAPRDIPGPGRPRRQSSMSSGYGSYPPPQPAGYGVTPPGGYVGTSPGMAYSPHGPFGASPQQHMSAPPNQMPMYGASPNAGQQYPGYSTSPGYLHPMMAGQAPPPQVPPPGTVWHTPVYTQASYPPVSYPSMEHRRHSTSSHKSHYSTDSAEKRHKPKRKNSVPARYESPRRPTMSDSVLAAWDGLKGAFDKRK